MLNATMPLWKILLLNFKTSASKVTEEVVNFIKECCTSLDMYKMQKARDGAFRFEKKNNKKKE